MRSCAPPPQQCSITVSDRAGSATSLSDVVSRRQLRSASTGEVLMPATRSVTIGDCAFAVAGPRASNSLPADLRFIRTFSVFKRHLKHHFFNFSFLWNHFATAFDDYVNSLCSCLCCLQLSKFVFFYTTLHLYWNSLFWQLNAYAFNCQKSEFQ